MLFGDAGFGGHVFLVFVRAFYVLVHGRLPLGVQEEMTGKTGSVASIPKYP